MDSGSLDADAFSWVVGEAASYDDGGDAHHGEKFLFLSGLFSCHDFTLKPSIFHFHLSPHFFFRFIEIPFASQSDSVCFEQSIRRLEGDRDELWP